MACVGAAGGVSCSPFGSMAIGLQEMRAGLLLRSCGKQFFKAPGGARLTSCDGGQCIPVIGECHEH